MTSNRDDPTSEADSARTIPDDGDRGKDVVDDRGRDIGTVADVEGDTVHVDPDPSLAGQVKSTLGWGDTEEALPVSPEFVERIDEEVVLDVERDEEFQGS